MSVRERIKDYISLKNITAKNFEQSIGCSNGYINNIRKSIPSDKLDKIMKIYTDLNITWLLTGEGDMILENGESNKHISLLNNEEDEMGQSFKSLMKIQMETIRLQNEMIISLNETIKHLSSELSKYIDLK